MSYVSDTAPHYTSKRTEKLENKQPQYLWQCKGGKCSASFGVLYGIIRKADSTPPKGHECTWYHEFSKCDGQYEQVGGPKINIESMSQQDTLARWNRDKLHVWKCFGKCMTIPPSFGVVEKHTNSAPCPGDHEHMCQGEFYKVHQPLTNHSKAIIKPEVRIAYDGQGHIPEAQDTMNENCKVKKCNNPHCRRYRKRPYCNGATSIMPSKTHRSNSHNSAQ